MENEVTRESIQRGVDDGTLTATEILEKLQWLPICTLTVDDYDEDLKAFTGHQHRIELQQDTRTKIIRTIKIED